MSSEAFRAFLERVFHQKQAYLFLPVEYGDVMKIGMTTPLIGSTQSQKMVLTIRP